MSSTTIISNSWLADEGYESLLSTTFPILIAYNSFSSTSSNHSLKCRSKTTNRISPLASRMLKLKRTCGTPLLKYCFFLDFLETRPLIVQPLRAQQNADIIEKNRKFRTLPLHRWAQRFYGHETYFRWRRASQLRTIFAKTSLVIHFHYAHPSLCYDNEVPRFFVYWAAIAPTVMTNDHYKIVEGIIVDVWLTSSKNLPTSPFQPSIVSVWLSGIWDTTPQRS